MYYVNANMCSHILLAILPSINGVIIYKNNNKGNQVGCNVYYRSNNFIILIKDQQ